MNERAAQRSALLHPARELPGKPVFETFQADEGEKLLRRVGPLAKKVDQRIMQAVGGGKDDFLDRLQDMIRKLQPSSPE